MNVYGMLRVRNGARWIAESVNSLLPVCQMVVAMDDHSTDNTVEILDGLGSQVTWFRSPYNSGLNEARDKTALLATTKFWASDAKVRLDWVISLDADEVLLDHAALLTNLQAQDQGVEVVLSRHILTLWDRPDQIRVDGIYGDLWRASIFKPYMTHGRWKEQSPDGPNLHCGSVPTDIAHLAVRCDPEVRVKHYGSMLQKDRIDKYYWYLEHDLQNVENEDHYRHAVQGDLPGFPARAIYRHGGPLRLEEWHE